MTNKEYIKTALDTLVDIANASKSVGHVVEVEEQIEAAKIILKYSNQWKFAVDTKDYTSTSEDFNTLQATLDNLGESWKKFMFKDKYEYKKEKEQDNG